MKDLKMTEEQRKVTLRDGQEAGEMLLDIEVRIGQLLPTKAEAKAEGNKRGGQARQGQVVTPVYEAGLTPQRVHQARKIAENPALVEKINSKLSLNLPRE
jgi:hypothetical protein